MVPEHLELDRRAAYSVLPQQIDHLTVRANCAPSTVAANPLDRGRGTRPEQRAVRLTVHHELVERVAGIEEQIALRRNSDATVEATSKTWSRLFCADLGELDRFLFVFLTIPEQRVHRICPEDSMRPLFVLGRTIFGGFFAYSGINHLQRTAGMVPYAAAKGVPAPEQAIQATGALLLAGGLSVMAGIKPRQGLLAIIAFLVPISLQMHRFWEETDPQKHQAEMINFMKNMALVGAALTMMQIPEPWPASIDAARAADEEMFVRLGGRDFRLPA